MDIELIALGHGNVNLVAISQFQGDSASLTQSF